MGQATYDAGLGNAVSRLRRLLGDVDTEHALLDDATYEGQVNQYLSAGAEPRLAEHLAAIFLLDGLAAEYGQLPVRVDERGVTLDYSERVRTWQALAATLRANPPTAGGVTVGRTSVLLPTRYGWSSAVDEYGRPPRYPL